jgi:hypothetical protein
MIADLDALDCFLLLLMSLDHRFGNLKPQIIAFALRSIFRRQFFTDLVDSLIISSQLCQAKLKILSNNFRSLCNILHIHMEKYANLLMIGIIKVLKN